MQLLAIFVFLVGLTVVLNTLLSAIRVIVLPRSASTKLAWIDFNLNRALFSLRLRWAKTYLERDQIMALYAPVSLLTLPVMWLAAVLFGYMLMFWALGFRPWYKAFWVSGSSLLTLGFAPVEGWLPTFLAFSEATIGIGLMALLIAYLPTMYAAFSKREAAVALLEAYTGSPPSAISMLERFHRIRGLEELFRVWRDWEIWFAELEESHTSLNALVFFRSPVPERSWITAAGAVLDAASLRASTLDLPRDPQAELCIRAGYLALRRIADFFTIPYDPAPKPDDPISISREEFDAAYDHMASQNIPLKPDRDQAWCDFVGWRVNYDTVLVELCYLIMAPKAPWSSDRPVIRKPAWFLRLGG